MPLLLFAAFDEDRIVIEPLSGEDVPVIESGRIAAQMPFADHASVVAGLLQIFLHHGLSAIDAVEYRHAILMTVFPGQDAGTAGCAN